MQHNTIKKLIILLSGLLFFYLLVIIVSVRKQEMNLEDYKNFKLRKDQLPIFYSPKYNISFWGLEKLHPFDSKKYKRIFDILVENKTLKKIQVVEPSQPTRDILLKVHSDDYLQSLKSAQKLARILELGFVSFLPYFLTYRKILTPMLYATGGTMLAPKAALERGWAINLGGGFHHAHAANGGGFCVYADITLAIHFLLETQPSVRKVMIIDLDAHQGNGHERDFIDHENVFIFDMYNKDIYPFDFEAKRGIDLNVELDPYIQDENYLPLLKSSLEEALRKFNPDIIFYNAGTDILEGDLLGLMNISRLGIIQRDEMVFRSALDRKIPIVMLLSGGYQKSNAPVIAQSIENLIKNTIK